MRAWQTKTQAKRNVFPENSKFVIALASEASGDVARGYPAGRPTPFGGFSGFGFVIKHMGSSYFLDPNERPHVYAHCHDLRQFPAATMGQFIAIFAAKERIQQIRVLRGGTSSMSTPRTCAHVSV